MGKEHEEQIRIVQETVAGEEYYLCPCNGRPAPVDLPEAGIESSAGLPVFCYWDYEYDTAKSAVFASDIAVKSGNVYLGFADRFTGTLIITGEISDVVFHDRDRGLFQGFPGICCLQYYKKIGSGSMCSMTKEELLERIFHEDYKSLKGKKLV